MPDYAPYDSAKQALGTLSAALFPDPNKVAAAGYAGAEQRLAMLKGNTEIGQQNANSAFLTRLPGSSGLTWVVPPNSPQGAGPVLAPAANLPMSGGGFYGGSPGGGAPPPTSAPAAPPTLSQTVAPGPGQAPPPQTMSVEDAANLVSPGTSPNPQGVGTATTPSPQSSPAPNSGAPSAPNTTGSDGSVPNNDAGAAIIHPGSLQAPGGGVKQAPPAQADGSPAQPAFNPTLVAGLAAAAGINPAALNSTLGSYIAQAKAAGVLDRPTADYYSTAFGNNQPMASSTSITTTGMNNATTLAQTGMQEAGATTRTGMTNTTNVQMEGMRQAGETGRTGMTIEGQKYAAGNLPFKYQPGGPGTPILTTTTADAEARHLQPYDPTTDAAARVPTKVQIGGPTAPPTLVPAVEAAGKTAYEPQVREQATQPVPVVDTQTNQPGVISYNDYINAPAGRYVPAPKELSPTEAVQRQSLYDEAVAQAFPGVSNNIVGVRNETAHLNPADELQFTTLANQKMVTGEAGVKGNALAAGQAALKELQDRGVIRKSIDRQARLQLYNDHVISQPTDKGGTISYYQVPTLTKEPEAPPPLSTTVISGGAGTATGTKTAPAPTDTSTASTGGVNLGSIFTSSPFGGSGARAAPATSPVPTPTAPPAGAVMPAPPGTQDGQTITGNNGRQLVARGGYFFPVASQPAIQGR